MELILADETSIKRYLSKIIIGLIGYEERSSPVMLDEAEDGNILEMVALDIFWLILDRP